MFATIQKDDSHRTHSWEFHDHATQTDNGVKIDGFLVEGATLEGVQSKEAYINGDN
jgi:hypothetical protein